MFLLSLAASMSMAAGPAPACLPGVAEVGLPAPSSASSAPKLLKREDLHASNDQLKQSRAEPPPPIAPELEPCDAGAKVQRGIATMTRAEP